MSWREAVNWLFEASGARTHVLSVIYCHGFVTVIANALSARAARHNAKLRHDGLTQGEKVMVCVQR